MRLFRTRETDLAEGAREARGLGMIIRNGDAERGDTHPSPDANARRLRGGAPRPKVMGILNVTPDSFSDGGRFDSLETALLRAREIVAAGADILDLGGESTRPGSDPVDVDEELARVIPILDALDDDFPIPISIDTRRAAVAAAAAARGATILNDTAALRDDPEIAAVARERGMTVVLMHRRGVPRTMQADLARGRRAYDDVVAEVSAFFLERVEAATGAGIPREKLILDPGIGFGKRPEDNDQLLAHLSDLRIDRLPLLVGASRKAFLGRFAPPAMDGSPHADDRLPASLAVAAACQRQGVETIRVHDVAETVSFLAALSTFESGLAPFELGGETIEPAEAPTKDRRGGATC